MYSVVEVELSIMEIFSYSVDRAPCCWSSNHLSRLMADMAPYWLLPLRNFFTWLAASERSGCTTRWMPRRTVPMTRNTCDFPAPVRVTSISLQSLFVSSVSNAWSQTSRSSRPQTSLEAMCRASSNDVAAGGLASAGTELLGLGTKGNSGVFAKRSTGSDGG